MQNDSSQEQKFEGLVILPPGFEEFEVERVKLSPLLWLYIFTCNLEKWEQAKHALKERIKQGEISPSSFIVELDEKKNLYVHNLERTVRGGMVEIIHEAAYQTANPPEM